MYSFAGLDSCDYGIYNQANMCDEHLYYMPNHGPTGFTHQQQWFGDNQIYHQEQDQSFNQQYGFIQQGFLQMNQCQALQQASPHDELLTMMQTMLSEQSAFITRVGNMEDALKNIKLQRAAPKTEYINAIELRSGTTLPTRTNPNADIVKQREGVELIHQKEFVGDPYSESLAKEYAKEDALKKLKESEATKRAEDLAQARKEKAKVVGEEAPKKPKYIPPPYEPKLPYPGRFKKQLTEKYKEIFDKTIKNVELTMPLVDALVLVPQHAKFIKDLVHERSKNVESMMVLTHEASAIIQKQATPKKLEDPGSFTIPCAIGHLAFQRCLCDLGASGSLMPLSVAKRLGVTKFKKSDMRLVLADRSVRTPIGVVEDLPVTVQGHTFPTDFIVLDMDEEPNDPIIFGRPFLATAGAIIDVKRGKINLHLSSDEILKFNINKSMMKPTIDGQCFSIEEVKEKVETIVDDNEESLLEIERLLYGSQEKELKGSDKKEDDEIEEVKASWIERICGNSTNQMVSPPKVEVEKKKPRQANTLDCGNVEHTLGMEGYELDILISLPMERGVERIKEKCIMIKNGGSNGNHPPIVDLPSPPMVFTPWTYEKGRIEHKMKRKGKAKPFAKMKATLSSVLKKNSKGQTQEAMGRVVPNQSKKPPWSAHTPQTTIK